MKKQLPKISTASKALGKSLLLAQGVLDQAKKYSTLPFTQAHIIRPRVDEKYYSWTHYGTRAASLLKYYDFNRYARCTCF